MGRTRYDFLIAGAGLYGSVIACEAAKNGKTCVVIDKRGHIGGNVYTEEIEGINVHRYGAHIFYTSDKEVWDYINSALILLIAVTAAFMVPSLYTFCATVTHKAKRARGFASIGMFIGIIYGLSAVSSVIIVVFIAVLAETADYVDYGIVDYNVLSMVLLLIVWFVLAVLTVTSWLISKHIANKKLNLL